MTAEECGMVEDISGFACNRKWWIACVSEVDNDNSEVKVLLHPNGPSRSFKYPPTPDIQTVPMADILTKVDLRTTTGRVYSLPQDQSRAASDKLVKRL